ncbi:succinate dehydrogenase subunit C [Lampropedia hyalina DSM 16112]|jgi:succinate dehydrogenase / fumarate reductase cytochrome b subunit|uniref:Succinate dehydrogenase cytochrome b556 subunit n=1 Tax=Lampropedia hyalina DSM 16112 TaxID=1122156 RepID=A0A1M4UNM3_9BURK|nr:succinate dehydrogenase, cytochrome b556 subunit [Lampropedia hyalina]SHE58180.1 succinate dehydrogenase subunit C [Lampropedia hyalina DSM 16112]
MNEIAKKRPEFRNLNIFNDVRTYRLPPAGVLSILHRVSGMLMFVLLPFFFWMFDLSLASAESFNRLASVFSAGLGFVPGWFFKLVVLALMWAYIHHLCAGVRHLLMDVNHHLVDKHFGHKSALASFAVSISLTVVLAAKLFGLY